MFVHTALVVDPTNMRVRSARQKVANAEDQDLAILGRLLYNAIPGLEVAVTFDYQSDYTGTDDVGNIEASAWLTEAHIDYQHRSGFAMRALYARWDFGSDNGFDPGLKKSQNTLKNQKSKAFKAC